MPDPSARLWLKDPLAILADSAGGGLVIDGDRIAELIPTGGTPATPVDATVDMSAHVVIPGLINTHHHFYQTLTRAFPPALNWELFPWLQALYPVWARLTPDDLAAGMRLALAELMLSGCTTTTDHHYVFPRGCEHGLDIEVAEARRLGIRGVFTRGSMNLSVKDGGLPPDSVVQSEDDILADSERLLGAYHDPAPHALIQIALAPCSPFSVTRSLMAASATLARRHNARLHTHLAETQDEEAWCSATFGMRPLDYLDDTGWLGPDVWLAHGIHFSDADMARLARAGTSVTHCPCSNMALHSGHCRVCELEAAGVAVGLGVDGSASNDASNLMQEVRQAFLLQRHRYGMARVTHLDPLRWATEGSAACIGRPELGRIAPGMAADLACFTLDELRFSGHGDPLAALVLCGAHRADRVMVAGRWTVWDSAIPGLDVAALRRDHHAAARRLQTG
jgi:8-oxoguanine deaminase